MQSAPAAASNAVHASMGHTPMDALDQFAFQSQESRNRGSCLALESELTEWRRKKAAELQKPAYQLLTNKSLKGVVEAHPITADTLRGVHGVGPKTVDDYGEEILAICQKHATNRPQAAASTSYTIPQQVSQQPRPDTNIGREELHANVPTPTRTFTQASSATPDSSGWIDRPGKRIRASGSSSSSPNLPVVAPPPAVIEPSMLTNEQKAVASRALQDKQNLFITGAAGTGKSFLMRFIIQEFEKANAGKIAITATTGLAAVNVGGQTVHSFAGLALWKDQPTDRDHNFRWTATRIKKNAKAVERWSNTQTLVIDEISMLEPVLFEKLDYVADFVRGRSPRGFGGMQLLLSGDFLQLPPVESDLNSQARHSFCFETSAWDKCGLKRGTVILQQSVRQSGDLAFARLLNEIRVGSFTQEVAFACRRCHVSVKPIPQDGILPTKLYCTNRDVEKENDARLAQLNTEEKTFSGDDTFYSRDGRGTCPADEKKKLTEMMSKKVPKELHLKVNAQVILIKKLNYPGLVNGSRGVVTRFESKASAWVKFDTGQEVKVEKESMTQNGSYGSMYRKQLPLKLGWALTVHKSQGMTLSRAELQLDDAFSYGQAYVALSRLTSYDGLWIGGRGPSQRSVKAHRTALEYYGLL